MPEEYKEVWELIKQLSPEDVEEITQRMRELIEGRA